MKEIHKELPKTSGGIHDFGNILDNIWRDGQFLGIFLKITFYGHVGEILESLFRKDC